MQAVSARFLAALRVSHTVRVRALIYRPGNPLPLEARVTGGQLRSDRDARVTRQGTLSVAFAAAENFPDLRELPFGGYARIERGLMYADGSEELVPIGHLRIDSVSWEGEAGAATLTLSDRMAQVQDEPFTVPWAPGALKPSDAARAAVEQVFGATIPYTILTDPATEPALTPDTIYEQDRAQAVGDLAAAVQAEAYFDPAGGFVLRPAPDLEELEPVWALDAGEAGVLAGAVESLDRTTIRNGVAVRGQAAADSAPIYALAVDDDPASPTLWGGPFGKVALVTTLTGATTQGQADETAATLLRLRLGLARSLTLRAVPNPALEPGDAIEVVFPDGRTEKQLVNALDVPLDVAGALTLVTTSHWRPSLLAAARWPRVYTGAAAWRELAAADEVAA
jgi:Domain of unknown function (DUF5047)